MRYTYPMFQGGIGFSTGTLRATHTPEEIFACYLELGCTAVEISPSHIFSLTHRPLGFLHVSTHDAPACPYERGVKESHERLTQLEHAVQALHLDRVVLHPNHVRDWDFLTEWDIPWGIENLDSRNEGWGTPDALASPLDAHYLPLVLDNNHCYTHDPSGALARAFQERFVGRIVEQHVSGYRDPSDTGRHLPLHETGQAFLLDGLDHTVPTILEIDACTPAMLAREIAYVREYVSLRGFAV
jgi:hypothetical protein